MKLKSLSLILMSIFGFSTYSHHATAEIYRYVDKNGNINSTNTPKKGAEKLNIPSAPKKITQSTSGSKTVGSRNNKNISASKAPSTATGNAPKGQLTNSNLNQFPKENDQNRNRRESLRAKILNQELYSEETQLKQAKSDLAKSPNDSKLKKQVLLHQKNIEAIHKELKGR